MTRLLPGAGDPPEDWKAHEKRHGAVPRPETADALIRDIEAAGLTGRGGAAFPAHIKLRAVRDAAASRRKNPVVIANGAESEPASDKDATLLWLAPHLVLDGLLLTAGAAGADRVILYTHAERSGDLARRLARALAERPDTGHLPVTLATAPPRFLSGQETAIVNHLSGGPAIPTFNRPRITERGLEDAPTLVQNVETLAHIALIARYGPRWFRQAGTATEPGSMLSTVRTRDGRARDGRVRVHEVPLGAPLAGLLGPDLTKSQAVLIGGYHGTWVPAAKAAKLRLDNESLRHAGAKVGAGIILALPADRCGLAETARAVRYLALESAGQCGPCLNGLPRISAALTELARGTASPRTLASLERWAGLVTGRGACAHPDGAARFVRSALTTFAAEAERHARGRCGAGTTEPFLPVPHSTARTEEDWL